MKRTFFKDLTRVISIPQSKAVKNVQYYLDIIKNVCVASCHTENKTIQKKNIFKIPVINVHCFVFRAGNSGLRLDRVS